MAQLGGARTVQRLLGEASSYTVSVSDAAQVPTANMLLFDNEYAACASTTCNRVYTGEY